MRRVVNNPVLVDLNTKQLDYLRGQYEVGYFDRYEGKTYWAQIFGSFAMDELNKIFDELEKLED